MPTYAKMNAEERAKYWLTLIDDAKSRMAPWMEACKVLEDQFNNEAASTRESDLDSFAEFDDPHTARIKAGVVFGWIDQSVANMFGSMPYISARAKNEIGIPHADAVTKIQNHYYRLADQARHDERVAFDAFLRPYGVWKIGYNVDLEDRMQDLLQDEALEEVSPEDPELENEFLAIGTQVRITQYHDHVGHMESHRLLLKDPMLSDEAREVVKAHLDLHREFHNRAQPDSNVTVKREAPYGIRWLPENFFVDPTAQDGLRDAGWIDFAAELPLAQVQADPNFKNTEKLKASHRSDGNPVDHDSPSPFDMVWVHEIWARNFSISRGKFRNLLVVVAEGHDTPIREEDEWPYENLEDFPAEVVSYQSGVRTWFNKPPLLLAGADSIQSLMNEILDGFLYTVRKQKNVWMYDPAYIDEDTLGTILEAPDGSMIPIQGLADPEAGNRIVVPLPFHNVPGERSQLMQIVQQIFDRAAGTPQPITLPGTESATESSILDRKNTARENRRSKLLGEAQLRKAQKFWALLVQFRPPNIELIDEAAGAAIELTEEMLAGRYNFEMEISSQSANIAVERQQWLDLINLLGGMTPLLQQSFGMEVNVPELIRRLLVRGYREPSADALIVPANPQALPPDAGPVNPDAEAAGQAIEQGRGVQGNNQAFDRDSFNRNQPEEGRRIGAAQR